MMSRAERFIQTWSLALRGPSGVNSRASLLMLLLVFALLATGCGRGPEAVFTEMPSPADDWLLRITVSQSKMPQGPFFVTAYLVNRSDGGVHKLVESKLENDGVPFTNQNIAARWTGAKSALLCLRATDRPDRGWRIKIADVPSATDVQGC